MVKRRYTGSQGGRTAKRSRTAAFRSGGALPKRAYPRSRVPLGSRGYRFNRVEKKVNDIAVANYNVNTTGTVTLLANPALGSDMNNRIGRKIQLRSVYIKGSIQVQQSQTGIVSAATTVGTQLCRMIILADLQPNGAAPAITDILNTASPASHLNLNFRDRFKIYCDKTWALGPFYFNTTATQSIGMVGSPQMIPIKKFKKINLESIYNATNGGTIADISTGALYMVWIGSTASGADDAIATLGTRVRYDDI